MVRQYRCYGCFSSVNVLTGDLPEPTNGMAKGHIIHTIYCEDTFMGIDEFRKLMGLTLEKDLIAGSPNVTLYKHRVTTDACGLGVFRRVSFIIEAVDEIKVSSGFGKASKTIQPTCRSKSLKAIMTGWFELI